MHGVTVLRARDRLRVRYDIWGLVGRVQGGFVDFYQGAWGKYSCLNRNLYLFTLMVCSVLTFVGYLVLDEYTGWFAVDLLFEHFWFVTGVPLAVVFLFIAINKMRKKELLYAAFMASIWVYWVTLILWVMNLQAVNFNLPPVLG